MRNVLVTGASGFIGSHIVDELLTRNYNVYCLVRKQSNLRWLESKNVKIVVSDFNDITPLLDIFSKIDVVIHVAGIIAAINKQHFFEVNSNGTNQLIEAFGKSSNLKKFIYISSQTVGGPALSLDMPVKEEMDANPLTNYAKSKFAAENFIIKNKYNIKYTILRPSAVFGERDPGILQIFQIVTKGLAPIMGSGVNFLNLIYAGDLANATVNAIESGISDNKIYYIGGKVSYNWDFLMDLFKELTGSKNAIKIKIPDIIVFIAGSLNGLFASITKSPQIFDYDKAIDFTRKYWICSSEKARKELNLNTDKDLKFLLKQTADWYKNNGWL